MMNTECNDWQGEKTRSCRVARVCRPVPYGLPGRQPAAAWKAWKSLFDLDPGNSIHFPPTFLCLFVWASHYHPFPT